MENQFPNEKQLEQTEKKAWVSPEMDEVNLNGGAAYLTAEGPAYQS